MNNRVLKNKEGYSKRKKEDMQTGVTCFYMDEYIRNIEEIPVLREARALRNLWRHGEIQLCADEIIVGRFIYREPVTFYYGGGTIIDRGLAEEWSRQEKLDSQAIKELQEKLDLIGTKRYKAYAKEIYTPEEQASIEAAVATSTFFAGHLVMDYEHVLTEGLNGIAREIKSYSFSSSEASKGFYKAMSTILEGIRELILRYAQKAEKVAEDNKDERERLKAMSRDLRHISSDPPETFRQALQLVWFIHLVSGCDSLGRFDQYLYPFLKRDLDSGRLDMETALELMEGFWIKIDEDGSIQNMTIGGVDRNGEASYNELTMLCLQATMEMGFKGPNLCFRVSERMPDELWKAVMKNIGTGQGLPALYNDKIIIGYLCSMGIPLEDARDFCLAGCSQVMIPGKSNFVNDIGILNVAKCLELTYMNGYDTFTGRTVGLQTGNVSSFDTFDEFLEAFKKQIKYFCRLEADINNKDIIYRREREGYAVRSLFVSDCLEKGIGVYHGGARYNSVQMECIGITNAADSLMAIKKAVFDEKILTFGELVNALKANFEGYEALRLYLLNKVPKFGNDIQELDELRRDITDFIYNELRKQKGVPGGFYIPGEVIFIAHEQMGKVVGATPDGRRAGEVLADSAGPSQGMDRNGPTAMLNSVLRIPVNGPLTSVVLNMKFMKSMWSEEKASNEIVSMFKSFFNRGGIQLQINVCDAEVLKSAMENPKSYQSLVVRVGGYSAYFTTLSRELQEEIIKRTAY